MEEVKYIANPVMVDALIITRVDPNNDGGFRVHFDNGAWNNATPEMCSRMTTQVGDYWVIQSDGYVYLNPKEVFERKYHPAEGMGGFHAG
jgi:hypothetical protein